MKICYLIQDFSLGGSTTVVYDLINNSSPSDTIYLLSFFDIFDDRYDLIKHKPNVKIIFLHKRKTIDLKFLKLFKTTINDIKPDVISCHLSCVFYLSLVYDCEQSLVFHTIHNRPKKDLPLIYRIFIYNKIKNGKIRLISCGNSVKEEAENYYKVPVINIQNGIDISDISHDISTITQDVTFLSISRLTKIKAVKNIIESFSVAHKKTNSGRLIICGYGPEENKLKKLVSKKRINDCVTFYGKTNDVKSLYKQAHVFCLLSKREGSPIVLLESMKYGLCSIGTNVPGTRDLIVDGLTGFLVKFHDCKQASKKMEYLMTNLNVLQKMRENSLNNARNYDLKNMVNSYYSLFKNFLLKEKK